MLETLILGSIFPAWTLILRWARWSARVSPMLRIPICLPWSLAWRNNRYPENVWREVPIARIPEHSETSCLHFSTLSLQLKKVCGTSKLFDQSFQLCKRLSLRKKSINMDFRGSTSQRSKQSRLWYWIWYLSMWSVNKDNACFQPTPSSGHIFLSTNNLNSLL